MSIRKHKVIWTIVAIVVVLVILVTILMRFLKVTYQVVWDNSTQTVADSTGGTYPRLIKLKNGNWLIAYDTSSLKTKHRVQMIRISKDQGKHWGNPILVAKSMTANVSNGQMVQLQDGTILCAYRVIGQQKQIEVSKSTDGGKTWSSLSTVASAPQGVWEPFLYLSPKGRLQVFFSSEAFNQTYPQVIEMKSSTDGGKSWSKGTIISSNKYSRDGMATVANINHGSEILMTFEATDHLNPFVIKYKTTNENEKTWSSRKLLYAPANGNKLASAPYVVSVNGKILVASFQTNQKSKYDNINHSEMATVLSDDGGRTWTDLTYPFDVKVNQSQSGMWNSLFVPQGNTIVAASGISGTIQLVWGKVEKHYSFS